IEDTGYFSILADGLPAGAAARMVADGRALVGVEIPTLDYSDLDAPSTPKIVVDATDPAAVRPALAALQIAYWRSAARLDALGAGPAVDVEWLYNPDGRTAWTIVPGLAGGGVLIRQLLVGGAPALPGPASREGGATPLPPPRGPAPPRGG